jgi:hypothetical protein
VAPYGKEGISYGLRQHLTGRGKSGEYLQAVSRAVHDALVAELHMKPEDDFQLIRQHEAGEMVFTRNFRGGPRSDDWIVFTITDGLDRDPAPSPKSWELLADVRLLLTQ